MQVELTQDEVTLLDRTLYDRAYPVEPKQQSLKHMLGNERYLNQFLIWLSFRQANLHVSMFARNRPYVA